VSGNILPFPLKAFKGGLKYLGFHLKLDKYHFGDWAWMIKKVEARVSIWVNRMLSRGGRLVSVEIHS
jgi:hypothetical protein